MHFNMAENFVGSYALFILRPFQSAGQAAAPLYLIYVILTNTFLSLPEAVKTVSDNGSVVRRVPHKYLYCAHYIFFNWCMSMTAQILWPQYCKLCCSSKKYFINREYNLNNLKVYMLMDSAAFTTETFSFFSGGGRDCTWTLQYMQSACD